MSRRKRPGIISQWVAQGVVAQVRGHLPTETKESLERTCKQFHLTQVSGSLTEIRTVNVSPGRRGQVHVSGLVMWKPAATGIENAGTVDSGETTRLLGDLAAMLESSGYRVNHESHGFRTVTELIVTRWWL